jgi:hypothetical protein
MTVRTSQSERVLDGRFGYRLTADWGHVCVLRGGGHICELGLNSVPGVNPLWKPNWKTIDPQRYSRTTHGRTYGPPPDGRLLAGIAGHSLSFDYFGSPSKEETAAGLSTHGEAPALKWRRLTSGTKGMKGLSYGCRLPEAQIDFQRSLLLDGKNPVVYCTERAENLSSVDRPVSWNEHVTFGTPFLESGTTIFDMPATRAKVIYPGYSEKIFLRADEEFDWPNAPKKDGAFANLRTMAGENYGHYTAQLLDPAFDVVFISACNPKQQLLVLYIFRRADFPWVGNWEERNHRKSAPWKGQTFCRGIEFSTTPFAIPRRDTIDQGPLFGERTYRWLPARSDAEIRFMIVLQKVWNDFSGVQAVTLKSGQVCITETGPMNRQLRVPVRKFLEIDKSH